MTDFKENPITLIIIDDIPSIVEGLTEQIPWEEHNISIVGSCLNGEQGMELTKQGMPDIVLTDIRMPMLDGIDMARSILEFHPACKLIFMTGFSDFEYAKTAVRMGAFDFISKPFSMDEVLEAVLKAKEVVLSERERRQRLGQLQDKVKESMPLLRQEYFKLLLHYQTTEEEISRRWDFLQLDLEQNNLVVMIAEINQFMDKSQSIPVSEVELVHFAVNNILEETVHSCTKGVVIRESTTRFVIIYNMKSTDSLESLADACHDNIARFAKMSISIGVGSAASSVRDLPMSYRQAATALSYHFYTGSGGVIRYSDISNYEMSVPRYPAEEEKDMVAAVFLGNEELALKVLDRWYEQVLSYRPLPHPRYQTYVLFELASVLLRSLMEKVPFEELATLEWMLRDQQSKDTSSMEEAYQLIRHICREGCRLISSRQTTEAQRLIDHALKFIEENWNAELTVGQCAAHVFLSSSYFASLFKKVTGKSFSQYVAGLKMDNAKQLLIEGRSVQEVATALGYEDRRNFSDMFKKFSGMTPSEYRTTLGYD
jgi:two-component system response regulator YesN